MTGLKEQLEKEYGRDFHFSYLRKLVGKVRNEIAAEIDRAQIEPRLAFTRDELLDGFFVHSSGGFGNEDREVEHDDALGSFNTIFCERFWHA